MDQAVMGILFIEFPDLQFYIDQVINFVYIIRACRFHLYFFFHKGFVVILFHPLFDPTAPFVAIPLYIMQPTPPPATALPVSSPKVVLSLSRMMMKTPPRLQHHPLAHLLDPVTATPQQSLAW